jgi:hypothetical protein
VLLAVVERTRLLPGVLAGGLEAAEPPLGVLLLERGAAFRFGDVRLGLALGANWPGLRSIPRRDRGRRVILFVRHGLLLFDSCA